MVHKAIQLILIYCLTANLHDLAIGDSPPYNICSTSTAGSARASTIDDNLQNVLTSLASNANAAKFSNASFGNDSDRVYGLYMCLNYISAETCNDCITTASQDISKLCPNKTEAIVWEEVCQLRYAYQNFFAFDPFEMYATDEVPFTNSDTFYALVQCTKDLPADDCITCLHNATADILSCCYFSRGARLLSRNCYLRQAKEDVDDYRSSQCGSTSAGKGTARKQIQLHKIGDANDTDFHYQHVQGRDNDLKAQDFFIDLETLNLATSNFSDSNILGQGGFGPVYKGVLSDGKEVAVKRLSSCSEQGTAEFTNEVLLILKLQHKNLVKLLGFCVDGDEKLLVYEFMPNGSLDAILFDPRKRGILCWSKRTNIVNGIAKGMLYLHEDSRLRIVHRDLKASNVLLDSDMNSKISDFGMARIFAESEGEANTVRIVGTYGYMAPEYAMEGLYSKKSDVFSFGVLLIEIITGRRNAGSNQLLAYAWHLWNEGNVLELVDPLLTDTSFSDDEFSRYIHIGLLCVQEDAFDRPTMSSVAPMLKATLSKKVDALALNQSTKHHPNVANEICALCSNLSHAAHQEAYSEQVHALQSYEKTSNNLYSPTYNPNWRNHPNFSCKQNQPLSNQGGQQFNLPNQQFVPPNQIYPPAQQPMSQFVAPQQRKPSLEDTLQRFIQSTQQAFQSNTQAILKLEHQLGQLATTVAEREKEKFPSQPIPNPKRVHEVGVSSSHQHKEVKSVMTLRRGKLFDNKVEVQTRKTSEPTSSDLVPSQDSSVNDPEKSGPPANIPKAPFPQRLTKVKKGTSTGNQLFDKALLDLGASVNLLPYSVYIQLG
ncbi:cysteine-rich receptor-like protein kinase 10 [Citrus sinensis]|nr:cysteine-rich receptor-like protein kinase 10 [Citrus sinensis]